MLRRMSIAFSAALILLAAALGVSGAGKFNKVVAIGDQGPAWEGLIGVDDKKHGLADLKEAKAVVVIFTCNHCPVAVDYEDRIIQFTREHQNKGIAVVAINVNNIPDDKLDKMKIRAEEKGFNFPYLYDPSQEIARKYGATCTPHLFLLDKDRKIAYMGAMDDSQTASRVKKRYLKDAVDAVLAGKKPEVTETRQLGCGIKYDEK